ncbi:hypothetical protein ADM98_01765 [Exiguobacterium sp. BMC-KP]|uniref:AAA family ATPase n=1 Tax=Exiguobacterium sp. BMC-KP TaxID=1684312 RepID=UPI0006AA2A68|nr:AAA family ATPase [Exiguobacterium sp. BMC-KP]KOP31161.1 hypothetical protein ADM98_01765 [Exiguobacterium sp. BMC-KP]
MIAGLLCRHYKIYQGLNFIPLCNDHQSPLSIFIGNNAVGKSSVLESINTFFNNSHWNRTKNTKSAEAFIAPIFLLKKSDFNLNDGGVLDSLNALSNYFWNIDKTSNISSFGSEAIQNFLKFRDELKQRYNPEEYLFFLIGMKFESRLQIYYSSFDNDLETKMRGKGVEFRDNKLLSAIKNYFSYIYIPSEALTSEVTKLENREMQELMSTDILEGIDKILLQKNVTDGDGKGLKINLITYLNNNLDDYMNKINDTIKDIDNSYAYKSERNFKRKLTSLDVRSRILEAYFSIRTLKKDKKEIFELSSGEQRIALIDIATAFLENENNDRHKKIILAIDEPENSLHLTKAFGQFERLKNLVGKAQLLITTHWYGSLPVTDVGNVHYVELKSENKVQIKTYDLNNYFEKRGSLPEDIQMKSYFDLTSSILSSIRSEKTNWIICEGSDDKLYLSHYLKDVDNLKILSVGGCGNVIKIYKYLFTPFMEKEEKKSIESKVLCLIDTDEIVHDLQIKSDAKEKLKIVRIQPDKDENINLQSVSKSGYHNPTEMEDCLNPRKYYESIKEEILKTNNIDLINIYNKFKFNTDAKSSRVKSEKFSILEPKELVKFEEKKNIYDYLDDHHNKFLIAKNYSQRSRGDLPGLFKLIQEFFI